MGKYEKLLTRIVYGKSDAEIAFPIYAISLRGWDLR